MSSAERPDHAAVHADDVAVARARHRVQAYRGWRDRIIARTASGLHHLLGNGIADGCGILMYHRVTDWPSGVAEPTWNVRPAHFESQLRGLLQLGYVAWPLRKLVDHLQRGARIPRNVFVVTFDDGYENNFTRAFPILRRLQIPATIFLATRYLDSDEPLPFDDWSCAGSPQAPLDAWRALRTAQCHEMLASGLVELAAHTHTHADFRQRPEHLAADLELCLATLRERFHLAQPSFAFPFGSVELGFAGGALTEVVRRAGLACACIVDERLVRPNTNPFFLSRLTVDDADTPWTVAGKLSGWRERLRDAFRGRRSAPA